MTRPHVGLGSRAHGGSRVRDGLSVAFAAIVYFTASGVLTWPVAAKLDSVLFGDFGDSRGWGWWVWAKANGLLETPISPLLAAPFGLSIEQPFSQPLSEGLVILIARISNEIVAMNAFILLSFPLTALGTYILLQRQKLHWTAALFGGMVFGFCPAAVMQSVGGHAAFAFNAFIPLFLLALFHNRAHRTLRSAAYVAAAYAGITFTSIYFGYFGLFVALCFMVFDVLTRDVHDVRRITTSYLYCSMFAVLAIVPVEFMAILEQMTTSREAMAKAGRVREFGELAVFASKPWNYLTPSIDHPVLGAYFEGFVRSNLHGSNVFESTLYIGVVPLGLLVTGVVLAARRKLDALHRQHFLFFAFGAMWMYFLSLPPTVAGGVPTVSFFAYEIAPMFRVYARFGILVNFFVACAGAFVLAHLYQRMKPMKYYVLFGLLMSMLAFEYWSVPPGHAQDVDRPAEVYRWLAKQPGDIIVAEYPMVRFDEAAFYSYPFWQRVHGKRLVNGASPDNTKAWMLFERIGDLGNPEALELLKGAGVTYVIVHKDMYKEGPIPAAIKRYYSPGRAELNFNGGAVPAVPSALKLHKAFGSDLVFTFDNSALTGAHSTENGHSRAGN